MKGTAGRIYDVAHEGTPVAGCTVSSPLWEDGAHMLSLFSMGAGTDISPELYAYRRIQLLVAGEVRATGETQAPLGEGEAIVTPIGALAGMHAKADATYLELALAVGGSVNAEAPEGKPFVLGDLVPYRDGHIVNMDLASDEAFKLALLSFDEGTRLSPHGAPGDALLLALEGEAVIDYEGREYTLRAGEAFKFDAGGRHAVRANGRFKMALLVTLN